MRTSTPIACLLVIALLGILPTADALYIRTPLTLNADETQADVGDSVTFRIGTDPENASAASDWGGKNVVIAYTWDPNEGDPSPEAESTTSRTVVDPALALANDATATFTWTVPEEVRDRNVEITVQSNGGDLLAVYPMVIGNAEPRMRIAASGPSGEQPVETPLESGAPPTGPATETNNVPGFAPLALGIAVVGAALLLARRR